MNNMVKIIWYLTAGGFGIYLMKFLFGKGKNEKKESTFFSNIFNVKNNFNNSPHFLMMITN
jgi:hypothetical protein